MADIYSRAYAHECRLLNRQRHGRRLLCRSAAEIQEKNQVEERMPLWPTTVHLSEFVQSSLINWA